MAYSPYRPFQRRFNRPQRPIPDDYIAVEGNTYPIKEALKALGARWDAFNKVWKVPPPKIEEAYALLQEQPPTRAFGRGSLGYRERHGRCEDAPCCGCGGSCGTVPGYSESPYIPDDGEHINP